MKKYKIRVVPAAFVDDIQNCRRDDDKSLLK